MSEPLYPIPCLQKYSVRAGGVLHVGAGRMEELDEYEGYGFRRVVWVDSLSDHVPEPKPGHKFIAATLDAEIGEAVEFHVASNGYSSSLLPFGTHAEFYPMVTEEKVILVDTTTGAALMAEHPETEKCNVLNVDVQGAEFRVLCGFGPRLAHFDCIYSEVYLDEVYVGCGKVLETDALLWTYGYLRTDTWIKPGEGWGNAFWIKVALL